MVNFHRDARERTAKENVLITFSVLFQLQTRAPSTHAMVSTSVCCHRQRHWAAHANAPMTLSRCGTKRRTRRCAIAPASIPINAGWNATRAAVNWTPTIDHIACAPLILRETFANAIAAPAIVRIEAFAL